ncbi:MAG: hypothetical protein V3V00_04585 [Saprospiraceae bacterium]
MEGLENQHPEKESKKTWFKRLGWGAFAFFFIKGLVWIAIFYGMGKVIGCG